MFDIAWTEYLLIAVVALILLGPKELPVVLRTIGRWVAKARQLTANFERQMYALGENSPLDKDLSIENSVNEPTSNLPIAYQRVFDKQHVNEKSNLDFLKPKVPSPKPWL
jgi:sec-independent protein translocase protein TatB